MPCGVHENRFRPGDRDLALPMETFALLHVGSLYDWRGLDGLIEARARVGASRVPDWQLWRGGDGADTTDAQILEVVVNRVAAGKLDPLVEGADPTDAHTHDGGEGHVEDGDAEDEDGNDGPTVW